MGDDATVDDREYPTNRSGFPIESETWKSVFRFARNTCPELSDLVETIQECSPDKQRLAKELPLRLFASNSSPNKALSIIQQYINGLEYNYTGTQFFPIEKHRGLLFLESTAVDIIQSSLPIKCLEAVILSIYLTKRIKGIERFTIAFKTEFNKLKYSHVVLGVYVAGKFGALGISRRKNLMDKDVKYPNLSSLITDYVEAYQSYSHKVNRIKIGLLIPHEPHMFECIPWKGILIHPGRFRSRADMNKVIEKYSRRFRRPSRSNRWMPSPTTLVNRIMRSTSFTDNSSGHRVVENGTKNLTKAGKKQKQLREKKSHLDDMKSLRTSLPAVHNSPSEVCNKNLVTINNRGKDVQKYYLKI